MLIMSLIDCVSSVIGDELVSYEYICQCCEY